jgi:RNA polymerase sigma factor (TIGR02999 family)
MPEHGSRDTADVDASEPAAGAPPRDALDDVLPAVYGELRRIAHAHLRGERPGHTLNTTSLVHEAYLRLAGIGVVDWADRARFLGIASRSMRRVLIDYARSRARKKRTGDPAVAVEWHRSAPPIAADDLLVLDEVLRRLEAMEPRQCRVVECRFFAGMTHEQIASALNVSVATVKRDWTVARAWLNAELGALGFTPAGEGGE